MGRTHFRRRQARRGEARVSFAEGCDAVRCGAALVCCWLALALALIRRVVRAVGGGRVLGGCWAARLKLETQKATGWLRYCRDSKVSSATATARNCSRAGQGRGTRHLR